MHVYKTKLLKMIANVIKRHCKYKVEMMRLRASWKGIYTPSSAGKVSLILCPTHEEIIFRTSLHNQPNIHAIYCRYAINRYEQLLISIGSSVNVLHFPREASILYKGKYRKRTGSGCSVHFQKLGGQFLQSTPKFI